MNVDKGRVKNSFIFREETLGGKFLIKVFESSPLELVLITLAGKLRYQALSA